uniref:DUF4218 domain-containing protein n=1 Tax=Chenopodium quinoa TaxID=63459 RepID=A0A803NA31_CHEQI
MPNVSEGLNRDHEVESELNEEARKFFHLVEEGKKELYPGCKLKSYVRNRSNPEASIAEGYMMEECLTFISRYLREGVNTRLDKRCASNFSFNQHVDELSLFPKVGHPIGGKRKRKGKGFTLDFQSLKQAHRYIVFNCDNTTVETYIKEHQIWVNSQGRKRRWDSAQSHIRDFIDWFFEKVQREQVHQVYYSQDPLEKDIQYVMKRVPRDLFDFEEAINEETYWEEPIDYSSNNMPSFDANHIHVVADVEVRAVNIEDLSESKNVNDLEDGVDYDDTDWDWMDATDDISADDP